MPIAMVTGDTRQHAKIVTVLNVAVEEVAQMEETV
jgi:hypothetical protein